MRLFLAVDPDEAVRQAIAADIERVRRALGDRASAFKWSHPENVHVTLHFLGELDASRLPALEAALAPPCRQRRFVASTGRIGTFPGQGPPRVIWLAVDAGATEMIGLHAELAARLDRLGLPAEDRRFVPHFTLARVRDRERRRAGRIANVLPDTTSGRSSWRVQHVTLFRSDLSGGAPRYEPLLRMALPPAD